MDIKETQKNCWKLLVLE